MLLTLMMNVGMLGDATRVIPSGGVPAREYRDFESRDPYGRRRKKKPVEEVIQEVAKVQVENLQLDEPQRVEQLQRELEAAGIEAKAEHFERLAAIRERLIEIEIGERLREQLRLKEAKRLRDENETIDMILTSLYLT